MSLKLSSFLSYDSEHFWQFHGWECGPHVRNDGQHGAKDPECTSISTVDQLGRGHHYTKSADQIKRVQKLKKKNVLNFLNSEPPECQRQVSMHYWKRDQYVNYSQNQLYKPVTLQWQPISGNNCAYHLLLQLCPERRVKSYSNFLKGKWTTTLVVLNITEDILCNVNIIINKAIPAQALRK